MNTRTSGRVLVASSLVGSLCAVAIIAWPHQVSDEWFSYPFDATWYAVWQSFFALRDVVTVVGVVGLAAALWPRTTRPTRAGLVMVALGAVLFAATELFALTATHARLDSDTGHLVNSMYGAPMLLQGLGLVIAGVGLARTPVLPGGLGRWIVLATGVYLFVPVFPSVFGPMVVGRIAIGTWLLLFAGIGVALARYADDAAAPEVTSSRAAGRRTTPRSVTD